MAPLVVPTGTITGQVVNAQSVAVVGVPVVAKLLAGNSTPQSIAPAGQVVPVEITTFTATDGSWSLSLVPNPNITPTNTTYVVSINGMPDVVVSLPDTASHPYLSIAVGPTAATLVPAGQTVAALTTTGLLSAQAGLNVTGAAAFAGSDPWFDVRHPAYGAKGDGVTDDTAAIAAALTAATANGGVVWVPPGNYRINNTLVIPYGVELRGAGRNTSFITALGTFPTGKPLIQLGPAGTTGVGVRIRDMAIDPNNIGTSTGVYSEGAQENSGVFACMIRNYTAFGIQFKQQVAAQPQNFSIESVEIFSGTGTGAGAVGLAITATTLSIPFQSIRRVTVFATGSTQLTTAIKIDGGASGVVRECHIENAVNGILVGSVLGCFGTEFQSITGFANVTNLLVFSNATSQQNLIATAISPEGGTNSIVDQLTGTTLTAEQALYALGNGSNAQKAIISTDFGNGARFGKLSVAISFSPSTPAGAVQAGQVFQGSGVPSNVNGNNGDVYFRTDTPGTANQRVYVKSAGAWVGIV